MRHAFRRFTSGRRLLGHKPLFPEYNVKKPTPAAAADNSTGMSFKTDVHDLLEAMRLRQYSIRRLYIVLASVSTFVVYVFYEKITDWMSDRATDVTSKSLEDPQFIEDATKFGTIIGKQIVQNLSQDPEVKQIFATFFRDLFLSDTIVSAAKTLSNDVVHDVLTDAHHAQIRDEATQLAKERIIILFGDPEVQRAVDQIVWNTINNTILPWRWGNQRDSENSQNIEFVTITDNKD